MKFSTLLVIPFLIFTGLLCHAEDPNLSAAISFDESESLADLIIEAEQGDVSMQYLLGFMYAEGQGITQDYQKALKWYTHAAEQGYGEAQLMLAMMYAEGKGIDKDDKAAAQWYTIAANQGHPDAQLMLAVMYSEGTGVDKELVEAFKWCLLAEAGGKDVSIHKSWLQSQLSPEQMAEAQKRADVFQVNFDNTVKLLNVQAVNTEPNSSECGFVLHFPTPPQKTIAQDNERLLAVHYQSFSEDQQVQYNASFQYFKVHKIQEEAAQVKFLNDYVAGRGMFAWQNKIQKKNTLFRQCRAALFKHTTHTAGLETIHEGIVFIYAGDVISLSCVYPSSVTPSPTFSEFMNAFQLPALPPSENVPVSESSDLPDQD